MNLTVGLLSQSRPSERELCYVRRFAAPRLFIYDAHLRPDLMRRWMFGPAGWALTFCELDARPGGSFRYEWTNATGETVGMGGEFVELAAPSRIVSRERFDVPWYPGDAIVTVELKSEADGTRMTMTIEYESAEAAEAVLNQAMAQDLEASYVRLEALAAEAGESAAPGV